MGLFLFTGTLILIQLIFISWFKLKWRQKLCAGIHSFNRVKLWINYFSLYLTNPERIFSISVLGVEEALCDNNLTV